MTAQVFKIKFKDVLRRISVSQCTDRETDDICFEELELKIRTLFQIPSELRVKLTYTDEEGDVITMADTQDLRDACLMQKLNPLKLDVKTIPLSSAMEAKQRGMALNVAEFNVEALLKGLFPRTTAQAIDEVLSRYPSSLFTTVPAHVLPEALDAFLSTLVEHSSQNALNLVRGDIVGAAGVAVHKNIECDICFMHPIVGPRYKALKKHDYDLCSNCFEKLGSPDDYCKLDRPLIPCPLNAVENKQCSWSYSYRSNQTPGSLHSPATKPDSAVSDVKNVDRLLDAEFVMDVTILDGSKVEVGKPFTKVWRLRNRGAAPWPHLTKLAHIGGDKLGCNGDVVLKLPETGLPIDSQVDASVELTAPEIPGRYVSNWRLQTPSGQLFGHSVWVLIEAIPVCDKNDITPQLKASDNDEKLKDYPSDKSKMETLSLKNAKRSEIRDTEGMGMEERGSKKCCLPVNLMEEQVEHDGFSLVENINEGLGEDHEAAEGFELISQCSPELSSGKLGMKENDANGELYQKRLSEDDTLASMGWDHMLKELEELGFHDTQANFKELLLRNEGSIKRAVKELVELEREMLGKSKSA